MSGHISKSKVSFSDFKPRKFSSDLYQAAPYKVGILIGRASAVSERTDDRTGEVYRGLRGAFRLFVGHDAGPASPESISSGICYMPDAWQGPIIDALEESKAKGVIGASVDFVYEVCLGKRGEDAYEWIVRNLRPINNADPLAELAASAGTPQIAAPDAPAPDAPAPAKK